MNRGDVRLVAGGNAYTGKPRPAIIFQDPAITLDSVIIVPVTSVYADAEELRVYIEPGAQTGLRAPSWAMADKIAAIPLTRLGAHIGALPDATLRKLDVAVLVATGIASR
ncbi:MAG: type II toxin-antitoxin system PemK/MazF family toxin [Bifidobacteriaceae bacterium]|jgi:mRNA interferase MazF|nr:type II toxin-antitoxin system PemK/MazF family toxin [Bifidobacteriaceae bacterium]